MEPKGVWLPIITPFAGGEIDFETYEMLINYYLEKGISGLIPLGTTGESPTIRPSEFEAVIEKTMAVVNHRVPVFVGAGGNCTEHVLETIQIVEKYCVDGVLSVCPYFNRPDQYGLYRHFLTIAEGTSLPIMIYNIPYRTGVNLQNETLFKLAELKNIVGVKDACGDFKQSLALLANKPADFSVLTGDDIFYFSSLVNGADGGILASAHLQTELFVEIFDKITANDHRGARICWRRVEPLIPLLFKEPNPSPLKFVLHRQNMISSPQTRLPLTEISKGLATQLEKHLGL